MNVGLLAATFGLVFIAELPDKTFIATVVLAARHKTRAVWLGSAAGLVFQAILGVLAGRLLRLLPHTVVSSIVTGLFFVGAAYLLFLPEKDAEVAGTALVDGKVHPTATELAAEAPVPLDRRKIALTTFGVIALAEFGDLTQVLIANLAAKYDDLWSVLVGASAAFIAISGLAVLLGQTIEERVPLRIIRRVSGIALLGLGVASLVELVR